MKPTRTMGDRMLVRVIEIVVVACGLVLPACKKAPTQVPVSCASCEAAACPKMFAGDDKAWGCHGLSGPDRSLCETFVNCVRSTHCATARRDPQPCFCGTAEDVPCLSGAANGVCKAMAEAAAKSTNPSQVAARFSDGDFPIKSAVNQIACDLAKCPTECQM